MNTKKIAAAGLIGLSVLLPMVALAQDVARPGTITNWSTLSNSIQDFIWQVFALLAIVLFVLAGISFMTAQGDPEKVKTARAEFLWGVVGVVVAILAYSIVRILAGVIGA